MARLAFNPEDLRRAFALAKQVKPATGDFVLKIVAGTLVVYSADRRCTCRAEVRPVDGSDDMTSEDYFLPADRAALFETDLKTVSVSVTDKGLTVKADDGTQSRQASVKKRLDSARRAGVPAPPSCDWVDVPAKSFGELVRQVSCSALVKETKTEEDMKVNQVHFYSKDGCAVSNARFYASCVWMDKLALDLSIVSADLPSLKAFCARAAGETIQVGQTPSHLVVKDPSTGTTMSFSKVSITKPPLQVLPDDGFSVEISAESHQLAKALSWSVMAVDGTPRLSLSAKDDGDSTALILSSGGQELSRVPARFVSGSELKSDFPVKILANVLGYVDSDNVLLRYKHKSAPTILEVRELDGTKSAVRARHFVQSMKERS